MTRDLKFGYGFSLAGVGLPYLLDKAFGALPALIVASIFTLLGIGFLIAGHVDKEQDDSTAPRRQNYVASTVIATLAIGVVVWFAVRTVRQAAPDTHSGKASISFGEGPTATRNEIEMKLFETGGYNLTAKANDTAVATLKMKPDGHVLLDVNVVDEKANSIIRIHDNEFAVATNLDRNSNENAYEAVDANGQVIFQLKRKSPVEIVINGVFKMKSGGYFLAGPEGSLETNDVRFDYAPKPLFKYPSWRYPGQYADATYWFDLKLLLFAIAIIGLAVAALVLVYKKDYRLQGLRVGAGVGTTATLTALRLVPTDDGPKVLLDYEWHDDTADRNAHRKDRPLYLRNSSDSDAMKVQINQVEHRRVKAVFDLIPSVSKGNSPLAITPTMEYNDYPYPQIRNKLSLLFLQRNGDEAVIQLPIVISYSDIQGRDYSTYYSLKYDRAKGQAIAIFERWGRLVEVKPENFLQRFVLKIVGRKQS